MGLVGNEHKLGDWEKRDPLSLFLHVMKGKRAKQRILLGWTSIVGKESVVRFPIREPHRTGIKLRNNSDIPNGQKRECLRSCPQVVDSSSEKEMT